MKKIIIVITAFSFILAGCKTMNKQQKGTAIGAGAGAAAGAIIGKGSIWGILAGAAIGGVAGNLIGKKNGCSGKRVEAGNTNRPG